MVNPKNVSIVIPNWNGKNLLEKNLPAVLAAAQYKRNNILEVIIVDDGSTDDSVKFLTKNFKRQIRLFQHTKNRGFSSACNMGVRMAKGKIVCLLNTDVIPEKNFLVKAVEHFSDKQVFAVGLHEYGAGPATASFKGGIFSHKNFGEIEDNRVSMWASGGSALFRRKTWMELKGFTEELFAPFYWEDVDLSYRAWKRGYKILWDHTAYVTHKHESVINVTNFQKKYMNIVKERNELLFIWRNITSQTLIRKHIQGLITRVIAHPGYLKIILEAWKRKKLINKLRKVESRESTVSDEAVFAKFTV